MNIDTSKLVTAAQKAAAAKQAAATAYRELRAAEYPPVTDGLDAIVKGGQALEDYKAACLAVKARFPKP